MKLLKCENQTHKFFSMIGIENRKTITEQSRIMVEFNRVHSNISLLFTPYAFQWQSKPHNPFSAKWNCRYG